MAAAAARRLIRTAGTETANRERLGDFYLYPLPERTTIANQQTKQVSFLDVHGAPAARAYEYRNAWLGTADRAEQRQHRASLLDVARAGARRRAPRRHGPRLPARRPRQSAVRRRKRDRRTRRWARSSGSPPAQAFDVKVQPVVESREEITETKWLTTSRFRITQDDGGRVTGEQDTRQEHHYWETRMRYTLTNARNVPVTVDLIQSGLEMAGTTPAWSRRPCRASGRPRIRSIWHVPVPANGNRQPSPPPSRPGY